MITKWINIYPAYATSLVYDSYEAARNGCGNSSKVYTVKLVEDLEELVEVYLDDIRPLGDN